MQRFPKFQFLEICSKNIMNMVHPIPRIWMRRTIGIVDLLYQLRGYDQDQNFINRAGFTISRWSRALIRSSSLRFASIARDISSFMSSASGLPRIKSIIAGSRFLRSTGGRSDGALSRGVEFSIDHLRSDCIVYWQEKTK